MAHKNRAAPPSDEAQEGRRLVLASLTVVAVIAPFVAGGLMLSLLAIGVWVLVRFWRTRQRRAAALAA